MSGWCVLTEPVGLTTRQMPWLERMACISFRFRSEKPIFHGQRLAAARDAQDPSATPAVGWWRRGYRMTPIGPLEAILLSWGSGARRHVELAMILCSAEGPGCERAAPEMLPCSRRRCGTDSPWAPACRARMNI